MSHLRPLYFRGEGLGRSYRASGESVAWTRQLLDGDIDNDRETASEGRRRENHCHGRHHRRRQHQRSERGPGWDRGCWSADLDGVLVQLRAECVYEWVDVVGEFL